MASSTDKHQWRLGLRKRLQESFFLLRGDARLTTTHEDHCRAFRNKCRDKEFSKKLSPLNEIEVEILALSSTSQQLKKASLYFEAQDVSDLFEFGIREERRHEVQQWLKTSQPIKSDENARVEDLLSRIEHTLSFEATTTLYEELGLCLRQNRNPVVSYHAFPQQSMYPFGPPPTSQISPDAQAILSIIHAAGGSVHVCFFSHAFCWGEDGEMTLVDVPVPELLTDQRRSIAVDELLQRGHLLMVDSEFLSLNPAIARKLRSSSTRRLAALQAVCKSFPRYPGQVLCASRCKAMLPTLVTVLSYLPELEPELDLRLQLAVVDVCISASYFGLLPWKRQMMEIATRICSRNYLSIQRVELRTRMFQRLRSPLAEPIEINSSKPPTNPRENGHFGEQVVFELKLLRDQGQSTDKMIETFAKFQFFRSRPSSQEQRVNVEGQGVIARAFKNKGDWATSAAWYDRIFSESLSAGSSPSHEVVASWAEVLCEQQQPARALQILGEEVGFYRHAAGAKLQLATAHASLMQALLAFHTRHELDENAIAEATSLFCRYQAPLRAQDPTHLTIINKTNYYVACAGTAMILHTSSFFPDRGSYGSQGEREKMQKACEAWEATKSSAAQCWPTPGYAHMIALYSQCELAHRIGNREDARRLRNEAEIIFRDTGRQYYFLAQGTIWPDILGQQARRNGWLPLS